MNRLFLYRALCIVVMLGSFYRGDFRYAFPLSAILVIDLILNIMEELDRKREERKEFRRR